jgi:hypothetical protein
MQGFAGTVTAVAALVLLAPPAGATGAPATAPGDPTPFAPNAVHAVYSTRLLESLEGFEVQVDLRVHEVEVPPAGGRSASELRAAPEPLRALFEDQARSMILAEAARVLPQADVTLAGFAADYGLEDYDADPYHPPLELHALVRADFTPAFFGLPATTQTPSHDLARALLYSGGAYLLDKELDVPPGFDVRYLVEVPAPLELREPGAPPTARLDFRADNLDGLEAGHVRLGFAVRLREAAVPATVLSGPLVAARFTVDDVTPTWKQRVPFLGGEYVGALDLTIHVHSLEASLLGAYPLPREVVLRHVSADLLRIALRERLVLKPDVEAFFDGLIRRSLEEGFGPGVRLAFDWRALDASLNTPVGGPDGATVAPLLVRAQAVLPLKSNQMLVSSSLGRLYGMTVGTSGDFDLENDGLWDAEYAVAYPKGVHVRVRDSAGLVTDEDWGQRDGFRVRLDRGAHTRVHVEGRSDFQPDVFAAGLLDLALLAGFLWSLCRGLRTLRHGKTAPAVA